MGDRQTNNTPASDRAVTTTRRQLLAATGLVAVGGLSGCLGRVAGATTNTRASPAAFYSGDASDVEGSDETLRTYGTTASDVQYVPATVGAVPVDSRGRRYRWLGTSTVAPAQDYNSSRSNKPSTIWWSDPDDDGDGVDDEVHFAILDVELALSGFVESAQDGVGRRSKTDSKKALDGFIDATTKALQQGSRLESCPSDVCRTVRENMDKRQQPPGTLLALWSRRTGVRRTPC